MSKFLSGRQREVKVGISSYSENLTVIQTIGKVGIGTTNAGSELTVYGNQRVTGVITASDYYIDSVKVIDSARQLNNILSLDATTTSTIENAIKFSPNTFTDLNVTGISTFVGNVAVGTTNVAQTPLQVETYGVKTGVGTFVASADVPYAIDTFNVTTSDFKTAEYTFHIGFGTFTQAEKVLIMQNNSSAYIEEYAIMFDQSLIVSVGATISAGNCVVNLTPKAGINGLTTYRFARQTLL